MNKVKTAHLVAYNSYCINDVIAKITDLRMQRYNLPKKPFKQKCIDFFFQLTDDQAYFRNSMHQYQNALHRYGVMLNFLKYYVDEEFVDVSDIEGFYAPSFYKFCAENNLTC
jgi:hypothetical protein